MPDGTTSKATNPSLPVPSFAEVSLGFTLIKQITPVGFGGWYECLDYI